MPRPLFIDTLVKSEPFRVFQIAFGCLLILVAPIIGIPAPGPLGLVIAGFGFALVLRNSRWTRRRYLHYTRRYPKVRKAVDFGLRRKRGKRAPAAARPASRADGETAVAPVN